MQVQVFSGRVRAGRIEVDEEVPLVDGTEVTVIMGSPETSFDTTPAEEAKLLEAIAEAERGDVIPAAEILDRLRR